MFEKRKKSVSRIEWLGFSCFEIDFSLGYFEINCRVWQPIRWSVSTRTDPSLWLLVSTGYQRPPDNKD